MKKIEIVVLMVMVSLLVGCAGYRGAQIVVDENSNIKTWSDQNYSFLQPSVSPQDIGRANVLNSQADLNRAMAEQIKGGNAANVAGSYVGILINQDLRETVYVNHPTMNQVLSVGPGDFVAFQATEIPDYVYACYESQGEFDKVRVYSKSAVYNGIKMDFGVRLKKGGRGTTRYSRW